MNGDSVSIIAVRDLEKVYDEGSVRALRGITLDIVQGEMVALRGPSGSGKSTLLSILGCLDRPTRGRYHLSGTDVSGLDRTERAYVRLHHIGFVFQSFYLLPRATALENVMLPLHYAGVGRAEQRAAAFELLARVGLAERAGHLPAELSGGERQRVAIARSLALHPPLLLADEPTGALDSATGREILQLMSDLQHEEGLTVVMVTHDATVAARADRQIFLLDGRLSTREEVEHGANS